MNTLRSRLIRLAHDKPELRPQLLPILKEGSAAVWETLFQTLVSPKDIEKLCRKAGYEIDPRTFNFKNPDSTKKSLYAPFNVKDLDGDYVTGTVEVRMEVGRGIRLYAHVEID